MKSDFETGGSSAVFVPGNACWIGFPDDSSVVRLLYDIAAAVRPGRCSVTLTVADLAGRFGDCDGEAMKAVGMDLLKTRVLYAGHGSVGFERPVTTVVVAGGCMTVRLDCGCSLFTFLGKVMDLQSLNRYLSLPEGLQRVLYLSYLVSSGGSFRLEAGDLLDLAAIAGRRACTPHYLSDSIRKAAGALGEALGVSIRVYHVYRRYKKVQSYDFDVVSGEQAAVIGKVRNLVAERGLPEAMRMCSEVMYMTGVTVRMVYPDGIPREVVERDLRTDGGGSAGGRRE